ncbi:MAG: hypothetical protein HDR26_09930 [Lachnospiraceae bacterium]|nr:hypothetical protein [Lachnospiraceae bacterium]
MDDKTFKNRYKQAYDRIVPREECMERLLEGNRGEIRSRRIFTIAGTGTAAAAAICLLALIFLPVVAKAAPSFYEMVAKYAPSLADYCLPVEYSCTSQGIVMQVEAINVEGNSAHVVVSFSDEEGGDDLIHGAVELLENYGIQSYGGESSIGGHSFLGYDEASDKAYFKMDLTAVQKMDKAKMVFTAYRLLTDISEEEQWISLDTMVRDPATREERLSGRTGSSEGYAYYKEKNVFEKTEDIPDDPRPTAQVMDVRRADAGLADELTIVGSGYLDGVLRVQVCRGTFEEADRHTAFFLVDSEGEKRVEDFKVGWNEKIEGESFSFEEHWFIVDEEELENMRLYGIFYRNEGLVKGEWEVTLELE